MNADTPAVGGGRTRWLKRAAFLVGVVLLAAACITVFRERDGLEQAWHTARSGNWLLVAAAVALPCVNWLLTSVMFWALMPRPRNAPAVGLAEMTRVIGAAWLANYLPARAGFFGRLAYHKAVNDIPVSGALLAMLAAVGCGMGSVGVSLLLTVMVPGDMLALAAPAVMLVAAAAALWRAGLWGRVLLAIGARYLDVLVWMARYAAVFALVGRPLSWGEAAAMAGVSQAAMLVPFVGNGLGVREWAIRLVAPALPAWFAGDAGLSGTLALSADLLNRAGEIIAAVPVGLLCGARLAADIARAHSSRRDGTG